jgi:hypothetical protein
MNSAGGRPFRVRFTNRMLLDRHSGPRWYCQAFRGWLSVAIMNSLVMTILVLAAAPKAEITADLGTLRAGAPLTHTFTITNPNAMQSLAITGVTTSCGCTHHTIHKASLAPGESTTLTVAINTISHAAGAWSWTATVSTRRADGLVDHIPLRLTGLLERDVSLMPTAITTNTESGTLRETITMTFSKRPSLAVGEVSTSATWLSAETTIRGTTAEIAVRSMGKIPDGDHAESITIRTNDPLYPVFTVPVHVLKRKSELIRFTPDQVELFADAPSMLVQLRRADGQPIRIASVKSGTDEITATWSEAAGPAATVRIRLVKSASPRGIATVTVSLSEPAGATANVPVSWRRD